MTQHPAVSHAHSNHRQLSLYDHRHSGSLRSSSISPSPTLSSKSTGASWHPLDHDLEDESVNTTASTWQEEAHWSSFRLAVQKFANQTNIPEDDEDQDSSYFSDSKGSSGSWVVTAGLEGASLGQRDVSSSLASDLAETKMRLALAQAERDELEFALFQKQPEK